MKRQQWFCALVCTVVTTLAFPSLGAAQHAVEVVSYDSGSTPAVLFGTDPPVAFDLLTAPLGEPERFTGEGVFPGAVSPFNPPFLREEIISIGEGGHLTLRLSNFVLPQVGGPEIGVFTNTGLLDSDFPNGQAGSPPGAFGVDSAEVEVSEDGATWVSLGIRSFDLPANGYTDLASPFSDVAGSVESDFHQPFAGTLSDFDSLVYNPGILDLLAGSGGGTWLDISGSGLSQVGYLRFSVADDGNENIGLNFELDAVSIAHDAVGAATVPEPATIVLFGLAMLFGIARKFW